MKLKRNRQLLHSGGLQPWKRDFSIVPMWEEAKKILTNVI